MTVNPNQPQPGVAPLWAVLSVTWLCSFSSGIGWNGMFFITEDALGFTKQQNLVLAAAFGVVYTFCAATAGRFMRLLAKRGWSLRRWLAAIVIGTGAAALLPFFARAAWSIWIFGFFFMTLIGFLWPTVEAYLSGGRRSKRLLFATGRFNLTWASALVVMMWFIAPIIEHAPFIVFGGLTLAQLLALGIVLRFFPANPAPAGHADQEMLAHESYGIDRARTLLKGFRILLMCSYTLHAALTPILPHLLSQLDVPVDRAAVVTSIWLISRFLMFLLLERWHGWHGRWRTAIWSGALMLLGVVGCVLAPNLGLMTAGLIALGAGVGAVYAAALYYAMEAGSAEVDAGGWHEAMIGMGYAIGPIAALLIGSASGAF
ncbi:MAG: MFS transporter [Phycisphaerales bacterium]|nr:MFS transporter [Phycisphaerales bacterium]